MLTSFFHQMSVWINSVPQHYAWVVTVCGILLVTFAITILQQLVYKFLMPRLEKTHKMWDDALIYAMHRPLYFLIWLIGIAYAADIVQAAIHSAAMLDMINPVRKLGIVILITWFFIRYVRKIALRLVNPGYARKTRDQTTVIAVEKLVILSIVLIAFLVVLQDFGIQVSAVVAFAGGGALVIGLAAKDILANFFGGLMIYLDRPFSVGDWIKSPDKEIEGTVEHIGWRLTRIRTFDKRPLYVPNALFSTVGIENPSRMTNRRIKTKVGIRYSDAPKLAAIVKDIEKMLQNHPEIDTKQTCFVRLVEFAECSLNILVYTFTKTTQWVNFQEIQEDVFLKIIDIVYNKHKASMAFPTRTVDVPKGIAVEMMK